MGGGAVPAGFYEARIVDVQEGQSRAGNAQLVLTFEVDPVKGRTIDVREYYPLMQSTAWKLERLLAAVGHRFGEGETVQLEKRMLLGKRLVVATCNEAGSKDASLLYMRVLTPVCAKDVPYKGPMKAAELEALGLRADGTRAELGGQGSTAPAAAPQGKPSGGSKMLQQALNGCDDDDDIPF